MVCKECLDGALKDETTCPACADKRRAEADLTTAKALADAEQLKRLAAMYPPITSVTTSTAGFGYTFPVGTWSPVTTTTTSAPIISYSPYGQHKGNK